MHRRIRIVRRVDRMIDRIVCIALCLVLMFGAYSLWDTYKILSGAASGSSLTHYRPNRDDSSHSTIADLQALNPDVRGWLLLDGTEINYPIAQSKDNFTYLTLDVFGNYSMAGSLFLDFESDPNMEASYQLIHGHHMENSLMFGDLTKYTEESFFGAHKSGALMMADKSYELEIFACIEVQANDPYVYSTYKVSSASNRALLQYVNENALRYRDIGVSENDKLLAMSTCASAQITLRTVVLARLVEKEV